MKLKHLDLPNDIIIYMCGMDYNLISFSMLPTSKSHQDFCSVPAMKLLGIMLRNR